MNSHDSILRAHAPFRRYASLASAGIDASTLTVDDREKINRLVAEYRAKFNRLLMPKFKVYAMKRSTDGPFVNVDEALAGESECFRRRLPHKSPLRIGINLSADWASHDVYAIRGAAVLALIDLCKARGQNVITELAYGNGITTRAKYRCHVRINLVQPSIELLTRVTCSYNTMTEVGEKCIKPLNPSGKWIGRYRFREFPWKAEYDFVLDRVETSDATVEEARVMKQLEAFKLT